MPQRDHRHLEISNPPDLRPAFFRLNVGAFLLALSMLLFALANFRP